MGELVAVARSPNPTPEGSIPSARAMATTETREPTPEERDKHTAEAEKHRAEAEYFRAQVEQERAYTRETAARARTAEAEAWKAELEREKAEETRRKELAGNEYHHVYYFKGGVDTNSAEACAKQLQYWQRTEPGCPVEIVFFSPGGSVIAGMALYDCIQQLRAAGHHVTTSTIGFAASMGGILLQAGDVRIMGRESYILIHEVATAMIGKIAEIEDEVEFVRKIQSRVLDIFASRSKLTKAQLQRRWRRKDWWIDSTEALKLGLVDEVR